MRALTLSANHQTPHIIVGAIARCLDYSISVERMNDGGVIADYAQLNKKHSHLSMAA
jgi:hypothetical protein